MPIRVVSTGAALAAAFGAGLMAIGWQATQAHTPSAPFPPGAGSVVVADRDGLVPELPASVHRLAAVTVLVADRARSEQRMPPPWHHAVVVDARQPLQDQLQAVSHALDRFARRRAAVDPMSTESARVASLTHRESQILDALMAGASADAIAVALVVSLPTVRTHIRAILTKLGVSSQLAAVAIACRVRCRPWSRRCGVHQF